MRCRCYCGCDYRLEGYSEDEPRCGACLDACVTGCSDCGRRIAVHRYRCRDCYDALTVGVA